MGALEWGFWVHVAVAPGPGKRPICSYLPGSPLPLIPTVPTCLPSSLERRWRIWEGVLVTEPTLSIHRIKALQEKRKRAKFTRLEIKFKKKKHYMARLTIAFQHLCHGQETHCDQDEK